MSLNGNQLTYCRVPQCKICKNESLDQNGHFYSNLNLTKHTPPANGSCKSLNCVYLISCKHHECQMKYVGYTTTPINKRMSGHRNHIVNGTEGKAMLHHFTKVHSITDIIIKPIEYCPPGSLRGKEQFWLRELNTVFPYGLNDRVEGGYIRDAFQHILSNTKGTIYSLFNVVKNNRTRRGSGVGNNARNVNVNVDVFDPGSFIEDIIQSDPVGVCNSTRKNIMKLKLADIKSLVIYVGKLILSSNVLYPFNEYLLFMIKDLCLHKLINSHNIKIKDKDRKFMTIDFINKQIDNVDINGIS